MAGGRPRPGLLTFMPNRGSAEGCRVLLACFYVVTVNLGKGWGEWGGERRTQSRRTFLGSTRFNCALEVGLRCNALLARACSLQSTIALPVSALRHTPQGSPGRGSHMLFAGGRPRPGLLLSACIRAAAQAHGCGEPRARACKKATAQRQAVTHPGRDAQPASGRPPA